MPGVFTSRVNETNWYVMGPASTGPAVELVFRQNQPLSGSRILSMKKRFSVEQVVSVLKQVGVGVPVVELNGKVGISCHAALKSRILS
jgi:hypothetical protein